MINKMSTSSMTNKAWYRSMLAGNDAFSPGAYELISTTTLTGTQSSVTLTSGGSWAAYKHLQVRIVARGSTASSYQEDMVMRYNSVTSGYFSHLMQGNGSTVTSAGATAQAQAIVGYVPAASDTTGSFGATIIDLIDINNTTTNKTFKSLSGMYAVSTRFRIGLQSGSVADTSALTSLTFYAKSNLADGFIAGSRFSVYGIKG